jgi:hypothetical protein
MGHEESPGYGGENFLGALRKTQLKIKEPSSSAASGSSVLSIE